MTFVTNTNSHPRVLVLGGNPLPWKAHERLHEADVTTGVESWVFAFDGDYMCSKDATPTIVSNYDIVIGNTNLQHIQRLVILANSRGQNVKWVSLIEGSGTDYLLPIRGVPDIFDASDIVININKYSTDLFRAMTKTRVEYIGIPFPAETIRKLSTPIPKRRKVIFLSPFLLKRWSEVYVARKTELPYYGIERRLTRKLKTIIPTLRTYGTLNPNYFKDKTRELYQDAVLTIENETPLQPHLSREGSALLWLNFDERYTWGRNVLDAAALEVPVISPRSTGHQEDFFPELMLETPFELEKAEALAKRLINDEEFYRSVCSIDIERFAHLRPDYMKARLLDVLSSR